MKFICIPDLRCLLQVYDLECNWKVFCDNYLDTCYHCPFVNTLLFNCNVTLPVLDRLSEEAY